MSQTMISIRMDQEVKEGFAEVCEGLGMSVSTAVNLLARQMIADGALPFVPRLRSPQIKGGIPDQRVISRAVETAARQFPAISAVTLFGSFARGDASETSDVDLRIEYDARTGFSALDLAAFASDVESSLGRSVDAVSKRELDASLAEEIARDGVKVYERSAA